MYLFCTILSTKNGMILLDIPPGDTTRHLYQTCVLCCGSGVLHQLVERRCRGKAPKMWLFDHGCVIEIIVFFNSFFAIFCIKTDKFLSFFLTAIYICEELSIFTSFSRFFVFLHISKRPATIAYPCIYITVILFIRISFLLADLLLPDDITSWE